MMDPKLVTVISGVVLAALALAYRLGRRASSGAISADLEHLHADLELAHKTPDPDDDKAVEAKIRAKERLKAAIDALPDVV